VNATGASNTRERGKSAGRSNSSRNLHHGVDYNDLVPLPADVDDRIVGKKRGSSKSKSKSPKPEPELLPPPAPPAEDSMSIPPPPPASS
jgi:hypothetical protein